jgi:hypothetical protein
VQVRALSGYGLSGSVYTKADNRDPVVLADVPYCSVFPDGALGLGGMRRYALDTSTHECIHMHTCTHTS